MRERGKYPQDCPRTVRSRRNRCGNTELACSPKYHGAKTAYWAVGRQPFPYRIMQVARDSTGCGPDLPAEVISATLFSSRSGTFRTILAVSMAKPLLLESITREGT